MMNSEYPEGVAIVPTVFAVEVDRLEHIRNLCKNIEMKCLGVKFKLRIEYFEISPLGYSYTRDRIFLQVEYNAPCTKSSKEEPWKGRKWDLSNYMIDDEIIKTAYAAFEAAVKHEVMEGFKIGGKVLFNPHVDYKELLKTSNKEVKR